ncbi:MAG: LytR family transcriptional regulator, partial [Blastococcus sp.]
MTVEQLLARQDSAVGRRRAARRVEEPVPRGPENPQPAVRAGLPPVPGGMPAAVRQTGLPPVPGGVRPAPRDGLPPVPAPAPLPVRAPASWEPDSRPSRRSGPIPPLPGLATPPA